MRFTTFFLRTPARRDAQPNFIAIAGEFTRLEEAREIAINTATKHRDFMEWCVAFEIDDDDFETVSTWRKDGA